MKKCLLAVCILFFLFSGCESLRFAPTEHQKQNAWLHHRTAQLAADTAYQEGASDSLKDLTQLCHSQSVAFTADYGMPKELPNSTTEEQILSEANRLLAKKAAAQSAQRPDIWQLSNGAIEMAIGVAGLLGGVYGLKVSRFLTQAKAKSKALREIIEGNELFKHENAESTEAFKAAHGSQSTQTRQLVAEMKSR
jgi:hypothetical protein